MAAFMGIPLVRVFAAWIPEGEREEDVWARMMPCLGGNSGARRGKRAWWSACTITTTAASRARAKMCAALSRASITPISRTSSTRVNTSARLGASGQRGHEDPALNFYGSIEETAPLAVHVRCKIYRIEAALKSGSTIRASSRF